MLLLFYVTTYSYTDHLKPANRLYRQQCPRDTSGEVNIYSYYKWYAKNGSHKLMAHSSMHCTYRPRKIPSCKPDYYWLQLLVVILYSRLSTTSLCCQEVPCNLNTSGLPEAEPQIDGFILIYCTYKALKNSILYVSVLDIAFVLLDNCIGPEWICICPNQILYLS